MTLGDFMKLYADKNGTHRVSLWELEVETGRWLGLFPVDRIPKDYADREVKKFSVCDDEDPRDSFPCLWIVVK